MSVLLFLLGVVNYIVQASASWGVTYPENLWTVENSCALIPCTFSYPSDVVVSAGITAIWYKDLTGQRTVVYHSASPDSVDGHFRGRTELLGDPLAHNCTLLLQKVTTKDSGKYHFRFEISEGNRWSDGRGVQLNVDSTPGAPTITAPKELHEGAPVAYSCSSPYTCPFSNISLRWLGYREETSLVSGTVQLNTEAALRTQTLNTSFSWLDHKRVISCEVSVGEQRVAEKVTLHVQHSPKGVKVLLNPSTKNLRVGDSASLTCNVNSSYPEVSAYRWFKDGTLTGGDQVKKTMPSVARGDYGQYHCEVENAAGTGVAEAVTLFVFSAVLSVTPSSSPREGEMVTLTCDVPGEDKQELYYSWYKNNIWIKEGTARILMFNAVAAGDTGYYSCKVQNDKGSEMSQTIALTVFYPPRLPSLTLFQDTQEGRLAIVYCTVDSNPQSTLSLYRDKRLIATTSSHMAPNQRISITATRNSLKLEIQKVIPEDEGEYECVATNAYGNASAASFFGAKTARVVFSPSSELRESEQVTLTCVSTLGTGDGITYTWYKNAKWLQEGKENSLVFPAVVSGDAGSYHCVAQNKEGSNVSPAVTLCVLYAPKEPVMRSFLEVQGGHLGIIQCSVDSDPPSELALYKGSTRIGSTSLPPSAADPRVNLMPSYNSLKLIIKNVTLEDEGEYTCSAGNRYGEATASMAFTANTARIIITPSSEVQEGQEVHLSCAVSTSSSSVSNYTWYKDGLHLPKAHGSSLDFLQVARRDAGNYYCRVENQRSSKSSPSATLSVLYPPKFPQLVIFMETNRGRTAIFQCSVDSSPPAKLVLYKGREVVASSSPAAGTLPERVSVTGSPNTMQVELRDLRPEDEGTYNLSATNPYGFSYATQLFRVQTARVVVTPSAEVLEGHAVTLTCEMLGRVSDRSIFSWYKNSKLIPIARTRRLTFPRISSSDAGSYHCKVHAADELIENVSPPVSITVFYPPSNVQVVSVLQTQGRQMVTIHCVAESNPEAHLTIYKKGGATLASGVESSATSHHRVSISTMPNHLSMSIWDVEMEDEGDYFCLASNTYGTRTSSPVALIGETARIWISPSEVLEGNSVNLTCAVDSGAADELNYTWYKDSQWYAEGSSRTLSLPHVTAADAGSYYCTGKTKKRLRNSSLGTLNVLYPPRKAWMKSFLETQEGMLAIIECTVDSNPLSALLLQRGQEVLADSSLPGGRASDHRRSFSVSPNLLRLEIKDVGLEDEGMYECRASNNIGMTSSSLDFAVETTRVEIQPGPDVREGDDVSLTCEDVSSPPQAVYTWYKNSRWLSEGSAKSLTFQNVAASDMGAYSCHIHHKKGTRKSSPVTLQVHYAPKEPSLTSFLETQTGNQAVIQCSVESHPPSHIILYRGDKVVATSTQLGTLPTHRLQVHSAHNSVKVEVREVLLEDEGQYQCFANNTYGSSTASIIFSVESARIIIKPSPNVQEGATANLTCTVASRAVGEMNFTWYKNSRWLREGPEQTLLLVGVSREDSGTYHCQAAGSTGRMTSALVILSVLYAPSSPSIRAYLDNQDGKMGIIDCVVDSHPPSRLALYKGDKLVVDTSGSQPAPSLRFLTFPSYNRLRLEIHDVSAEDSGRYVCQAGNQFGSVASAVEFSTETLSDLHLFKILAGIFIALACAALLGGLAFGLQTRWTRIKEEYKRWREHKSKKPEPVADPDTEEAEQLNELNAETPPPGRFCVSYQKLQTRAKTPPKDDPSAQSCTSV